MLIKILKKILTFLAVVIGGAIALIVTVFWMYNSPNNPKKYYDAGVNDSHLLYCQDARNNFYRAYYLYKEQGNKAKAQEMLEHAKSIEESMNKNYC